MAAWSARVTFQDGTQRLFVSGDSEELARLLARETGADADTVAGAVSAGGSSTVGLDDGAVIAVERVG